MTKIHRDIVSKAYGLTSEKAKDNGGGCLPWLLAALVVLATWFVVVCIDCIAKAQ